MFLLPDQTTTGEKGKNRPSFQDRRRFPIRLLRRLLVLQRRRGYRRSVLSVKPVAEEETHLFPVVLYFMLFKALRMDELHLFPVHTQLSSSLRVKTYRTVVLPDSLSQVSSAYASEKRAYPAPSNNNLSSLCKRRASSFNALSIMRDFLISSINACESSCPLVGPAGVDAQTPIAVCLPIVQMTRFNASLYAPAP